MFDRAANRRSFVAILLTAAMLSTAPVTASGDTLGDVGTVALALGAIGVALGGLGIMFSDPDDDKTTLWIITGVSSAMVVGGLLMGANTSGVDYEKLRQLDLSEELRNAKTSHEPEDAYHPRPAAFQALGTVQALHALAGHRRANETAPPSAQPPTTRSAVNEVCAISTPQHNVPQVVERQTKRVTTDVEVIQTRGADRSCLKP